MAFTEFFCRSGGNNMNGGHINANTEPSTTPGYSGTNGGWNSGTGLWTAASGSITGVAVGDFAHVFTDGSTTPTRIARVTAFNASGPATITLSTTAGSGTAPTTAGTGISINVGGAWKGPNGTDGFPFNLIVTATTDSTINRPRINLKNDQTYNITAVMTAPTTNGPVVYQGYTTIFGDLGRATIDGGTSGASYALLSNNAALVILVDLIFQNNGATGNATLVDFGAAGGATGMALRCVFAHARGSGVNTTNGGGPAHFIECEAYDCNQNNTANLAGFAISSNTSMCLRCISHDNSSGSNCHGFFAGAAAAFQHCIADTNGGSGFKLTNNGRNMLICCDAYSNTGDGLFLATGGGTATLYVENCNFILNGGYGINTAGGGGVDTTYIYNCGFYANTTSPTNFTAGTDINEMIGTVTYGSSPYVDAPNGDFRLNTSLAKNTGRGGFTETAASYAGTVGYPDIGAAQHQETTVVPALVSLPSPVLFPGVGNVTGNISISSAGTFAASQYLAYVIQAKENMTISHVNFRTAGTVTGPPTVDVRIETLDATGFPTGTLWNLNGTGANPNVTSGTLTANGNFLVALTNSAVILKTQLFAVVFKLVAGTNFSIGEIASYMFPLPSSLPYRVVNTGTPTKGSFTAFAGCLGLGSSATTWYQMVGFLPWNGTLTGGTFNNTNSAQRGLRFIPPMNCRAIGIRWWNSTAVGDCNIVLYDNNGVELSSSSTAMDGDSNAVLGTGTIFAYFDNPVTLTAGVTYRAAVQPTTSTNVNVSAFQLVSSSYMGASPLGAMGNYTTFASGSWTDTTDQVPLMDVILDQVYDGITSLGGGTSPIGDIKIFGRGAPY